MRAMQSASGPKRKMTAAEMLAAVRAMKKGDFSLVNKIFTECEVETRELSWEELQEALKVGTALEAPCSPTVH